MKLSNIVAILLPALQTPLAIPGHGSVPLLLAPELDAQRPTNLLLVPELEAEKVEEVALSFTARLARPADDRHPFWVFEWDQLVGRQVLECAVMLFFAGLLCSAGGIGGGGIYVTALMVAGRLSPRDAVPLSKAIVFFGSLSSLVLNLGRTLTGKGGVTKGIIDYSICRLVVPAALMGTLFGVVINRNAKDKVIVLVLSAILIAMTAMVMWTTWTQYLEEEEEAAKRSSGVLVEPAGDVEVARAGGGPPGPEAGAGAAPEHPAITGRPPEGAGGPVSKTSMPLQSDKFLGFGMLLVVVISGVVRHHASACLWELEHGSGPIRREAACHHPTLGFLVGNRLEGWMGHPWGPTWAMLLTLIVPISTCSAVMAFNSRACVLYEHWTPFEVAKYEMMGMLTGCLAGLVGIGGGLVFSPFFLIMGVEPGIAVATSSTCVIFTSSSTTLQYLFTDRIIVSLAVVYGIINVVASYGGTAFVHFIQDRFSTRRSYITAIVAIGVLVSAMLSLAKLGSGPEAVHA